MIYLDNAATSFPKPPETTRAMADALTHKDENGDYTTKLFSKEQTYKSMLKILGY